MSNEIKTIGVFGNSRGGTSAVIGVVKLLGVTLYSARLSLDDPHMLHRKHWLGSINKRNRETPVWGFKYPNIADKAGEIGELCTNPRFIFVSRDPFASLALGQAVKYPVDLKEIDERHLRITTGVRQCVKLGIPHTVISYEKLIEHPEKVVRYIADFIDQPFTEEAVKHIDPIKGYQSLKD